MQPPPPMASQQSQQSSQQSFSMSQPSQQPAYRQYTEPPPRPSNDSQVPIYTATYSGVNVYEMDVNGVAVMRRQLDGWLNATQILKVAGVEKGRRTKILEKEIQTGEHEKVQGGYGKYQGTWIPFDRGLQVCEQYGVKDILNKLLTHNRNADGGAGDVDTPTKEQAMAAQRKRMYSGSQENRSSGLSGTFFKNISATASHAVAAISKARFDSPGPRNRSGPTRAPSFNRQSSMNQEMNDFPSNSQQSFVSDYGQNSESAFGSQTTQPMNGDGMDQPPRKRQRVLTPANSFGGLTPTYPPLDSYNGAFPGSPTEPNESFIYSQAGLNPDAGRPFGPVPLRPLPHDVSPQGDIRRSKLMNLFMQPEGPEEKDILPLQDMISQDIDMPLDAQSHNALHWAATLARLPLLRVLIQAGSNPFRCNAAGETALMKVVTVTNSMEQNCFPEILDLLGGTVDVVDDKGRTILHHIAFTSAIKGRSAASRYYLECLLEWVVRQGSAPNSQALPNSNNGAARMGIARFMNEVVNKQDNAGDTALNVAARVGMRSIVSQLIEVGADPNIENHVGLKPTDFGVGREVTDGANVGSGANGNNATQQKSQNSKGNSEDMLNSISHLITETTQVFQDEGKRKQDSIDTLKSTLRITTQKLLEERRVLEDVHAKVKYQTLARSQVTNLAAACMEEEFQLKELENRHGGLDVAETNAFEVEMHAVVKAAAADVREKDGAPLGATLPRASVLRARINALRNRTVETSQAVANMQARSKERELQYRRLVSLCTKCPDAEVEGLLDALNRAVDSEHQNLEIPRVQRFLSDVASVGQ
ncbi:hypothetical protein B0T14DRAFT_587110 [Immersiella caudata]|uniref:Transcription factor SWI6 n=1 Tax=Immersiella caudata TaxID=314043 RepID=A0AA39WSR7_9PEZI|nr:hypothetical protein B0T14DRAFT_587110 [Immersiella caudata]